MRWSIPVITLCLFLPAIFSFAQSNQNETLTIATYYPSPYGVYRNLRLNPTTQVPVAPALSTGVMYYDSRMGYDMIRYYNGTGKWVNLTSTDKFENRATCYLQTYGTSGYTACTPGYYTTSGLANATGGKMLCCTVDHIN